MAAYDALNLPPQIRNKPANEVLRAAVLNGELHISLRRGFADPAAWGLLFVEAARHVARSYAHEKMFSEQDAFERIRQTFEEAVRQPAEGVSKTTEFIDPN
jgi:hypothetical protein